MATVLLLHCDGADGSTTFTDVKGHVVTANGNAQISTAQSKFGGASAAFGGFVDYLTTPYGSDWGLSGYSGDFTLECWIYSTGTGGGVLLTRTGATFCTIYLSLISSAIYFQASKGAGAWDVSINTGPLTLNAWHHIAATRHGNIFRVFLDGTQKATVTVSGALMTDTNPLTIGRDPGGAAFAGYLDEVRITKGAALYTADFTPPSAPFPDYDGLLIPAPVSGAATLDTPALIQERALSPAAATGAAVLDTVVLTQILTLAIADSAATGTIDTPALIPELALSPAAASGTAAVDSPLLTRLHFLAIGAATAAGALDTPALIPELALSPVAASGSAAVDSVPLARFQILAGTDASASGALDTPALILYSVLVPVDPAATGALASPALLPLTDPDPEPPPASGSWSLSVALGGADVSGRLTGRARVEAERGGARIAEFALLPTGGTVNPESWVGATVAIAYAGVAIFNGRVEAAAYDPATREVSFSASDGLQATVNASSRAALAALIGGRHHPDVFAGSESLWDYAQARLSTVPVTLDLSVAGDLRVLPWVDSTAATTVWAAVLDETLAVGPFPERRNLVNRATLAIDYRYTRKRQRQHSVAWVGAADICTWAAQPHDLPTVGMLEQVVRQAGWSLQGEIAAAEILAGNYPCTPVLSISQDVEDNRFCLSAAWTAARRVTQTVTEHYELRSDCAASIATAGVLEDTADLGFEEAEDGTVRGWESEPYDGLAAGAVVGELGDHILDDRDEARWQAAALCALDAARIRLLQSQRGYYVSFSVLCDPALDLGQRHRLAALTDLGVDASGHIDKLVHEFDFAAATDISTVTLDCSRAGLRFDPAVPGELPARPGTDRALPHPPGSSALGSYIGGNPGAEPYDDTWQGWSGNWQFPTGDIFYEKRFRLDMPGVDAEARDPVTFTQTRRDYAIALDPPSLEIAV